MPVCIALSIQDGIPQVRLHSHDIFMNSNVFQDRWPPSSADALHRQHGSTCSVSFGFGVLNPSFDVISVTSTIGLIFYAAMPDNFVFLGAPP